MGPGIDGGGDWEVVYGGTPVPTPTAIVSTLLLLEVVALGVQLGVVTCVNGELQLLLVAATAGPVVGSAEDGEGVRGCAPALDPALVGSAAPAVTAPNIGGGVAGSSS